ncbi:N-formylglutamate amidohydrolase [Comamonas aquatica]|jgi:N-formylglutamate deformylase|uniref:N-formylglutamate amidohydrolase n=1 Tax=Comamonas aquatica TaxID=225991 RepID=A0AA43AW40_9BURK|nr:MULTISPECIES: N-formylglutamate amidohydrolase [Comamonas]MDH0200364.1 N-formylglutamate amidohydrolase [Comamonas aquatica]MDH0361767.1 N-formylglutamate amidohydrolase [Comamonas aquatica]MDH0371152.1 N-formylglutamate amidohydrolase [Comamonas aquatica]MDH0900235.1 N-formylglutamate amidohydrolase [Comamonas aquatica]MDH1427298.1 N-formylglutamate amidohydrolase [Comamonas aquatica]
MPGLPDFLQPRPEAPVRVHPPQAEVLPLVCDSPHSGTAYPADFGFALPLAQLRRGEDSLVDRLWQAWPEHGATLVEATFPRTYIDPNREEDDINPAMLDGPWPTPLHPSPKTLQGLGLVWEKLSQAGRSTPVYDRALSVAEVQQRIERYWRPYHAALAQAIRWCVGRFGGVWHINLHSMPSDVYQRLGTPEKTLADFVLGDRDGTTCDPDFIRLIGETLQAQGYSVAYNEPYKGVALIGRIGQPHLHRHSLQIEINRRIYLDEDTRLPSAGFAQVQQHLQQLMPVVAEHVRQRMRQLPRA